MAKHQEDPDAEMNFEMMARKELAQLQRQYRVMETDRQTFIQGKGRNANRQGKMLEYLRNERADLIVDITNALSPLNLKNDKESENIIVSMLEAYFKCVAEIHAQIDEIIEMEAQVDKTTKHVIAQKLKTQAIFGRSLTMGQVSKRLRVLENRKYHATTQFDSKVTQNSLLRADINLSLMERGRFHERYRQLKRQIAAVKHKMLIVVDNALTTYEGREEAVMKIHMLRDRNDKESQHHVLEIKEYQRVFHHDQKLRAFMEIKNKTREVVEKLEDRKMRITMEKERHLDDLIRQYKRSFAQLLNLAQTKDVETLLHQYLSQEQANFSSFKFITDLNNETCVLEEAIQKLKTDIERAAKAAKENKKERAIVLKDLNKVYNTHSVELADLQMGWDTTEEHMNKVIHAIDVVFDKAGCANAPVIQLLGNRSGILPRNLCLCLKVLEHRIGELQYNRNLLEIKKAIVVDKTQVAIRPGVWAPGKKPAPTGGPFKPKVILTGQLAGDVEEDDDETERQISMRRMTYQEIKTHYQSKLMDQQPPEVDDDSSVVKADSMTNIPTKPKFGPIIKPTPEVRKTSTQASENDRTKKASISEEKEGQPEVKTTETEVPLPSAEPDETEPNVEEASVQTGPPESVPVDLAPLPPPTDNTEESEFGDDESEFEDDDEDEIGD